MLMYLNENDPYAKARVSGLMQGLAELGWIDGRNLRMDVRSEPSLAARQCARPHDAVASRFIEHEFVKFVFFRARRRVLRPIPCVPKAAATNHDGGTKPGAAS